jgi:hypothetical protein
MAFNDDMEAQGHRVINARFVVHCDSEDRVIMGMDGTIPTEQTGTTYIPAEKVIIDSKTHEITDRVKNQDRFYFGATVEEILQKMDAKQPDIVPSEISKEENK